MMDWSPVLDWLNLFVRWSHLIFGIAWIGTSFYFVWQDNVLEPAPEDPGRERIQGDAWLVHGGGFYHARKFKLAPPALPDHLHWFKWEAYATWISGVSLLVIVYWAQAGAFLVEPGSALTPWTAIAASAAVLIGSWVVYELICGSPLARNPLQLAVVGVALATILAYGLTHLFPGRAALLHIGAALGSIMATNVFAVIIPNQRKAVNALIKGEIPDPKYGKLAKQRSVHNTYLTLPVLFMMISNHFPMIYQHRWNWLIVLGLSAIGGLIRHIFVLRHTHRDRAWMMPAAVIAGIVVAIAATLAPSTAAVSPVAPMAANPSGEDDGTRPAAPFPVVQAIINQRCVFCHASKPKFAGLDAPPKGVRLDEPALIKQWAAAIQQQAVTTPTMPLGNVTNMQPEERAILGKWIADGAPISP
jgi:uncharacterized membrane protein